MNGLPAKLFCQTGSLAGTEVDISGDIYIGRQSNCDLVLYPHTVSAKHARIFFNPDDSCYYIEDLGSSNGTWVDRVRVEHTLKLDTLNVITFASDIDFIFQVFSETAKRPATPSHAQDPATATPSQSPPQQPVETRSQTVYQKGFAPPPDLGSAGEQDRMHTVYQKGFAPPPDFSDKKPDETPEERTKHTQSFDHIPSGIPQGPSAPDEAAPPAPKRDDDATIRRDPPKPPLRPSKPPPTVRYQLLVTTKGIQERFMLKEGTNTIGRSSSCDVPLQDPFISSTHALLQIDKGKIVLTDLESSNKTYVNGKPISKPVEWKPGMAIRLGPNAEVQILSS